jgi:TonB family protein
MQTVADAKDSEVWEPVAAAAGERRTRHTRLTWTFGVSTAVIALVASFGVHALLAANVPPVAIADAPAEQPVSAPFHVSLEHRAQPRTATAAKPKPEQPGLVVVHNVITLKQTDRAESKPQAVPQTTVVAKAPVAPPQTAPIQAKSQESDVPVWRRDAALPRAKAPAAESATSLARTDTPTVAAGQAESIAVAPAYIVREVVPIGGDTAINPRPAPIAYAMGAEGTTAFEVSVDERGTPVKCTITKTSGYLVLDTAVCKAAMAARYSPRTVNGHPTSGIYRDAFTFRASPNDSQQL